MSAIKAQPKTNRGNFFEDFKVGQTIVHSTPRTVTDGDVALYNALYGSRFAVQSADSFAQSIGYPQAPVDDMLVFHMVFGKSVPDISLNAVANLGYAEGRFIAPVFVGDSLSATSTVIGLKQNSNGKTGVVFVRTTGTNQREETVLEYVRWVMVKKGDLDAPAPETVQPELADSVAPELLGTCVPPLKLSEWNNAASGSPFRWGDYEVGEKIDHIDGMTVEEAEHQLATRLYQNTAKVHFNRHSEKDSRFGRRLIYGGHVISLARALSFNGMANAFHIAAINGGRHIAPLFAGDTVYAWSEVLDKQPINGRDDIGALRMRLVATKDKPCSDYPLRDENGAYQHGVILDFDYWVTVAR
ncbi:MaoC family dehydratase [Rhodobacteraceae bacterium RKSG542]|uniref:MaoC family dehydratase n=1 Tax=Pseudovibrio flavus TaxID=2529854 RepID=UPI0012BB71EF|nr:MaoC family dehydratase [Pseudovibrio flavus]MTI16801.1 MaoC family dehydratase [Pseudovibrio flavus]